MSYSMEDITLALKAASAPWNDSRFKVVEITEAMIAAADYRTVASLEYGETGYYVEPAAFEPDKGTINLLGRVINLYPDQLPSGYAPICRGAGLGYRINDQLYTKTYTL